MTHEPGAKGTPGPFTDLELAAHVGGYALRSSATTEPLGLVADLLYALGWALWTGVVLGRSQPVLSIRTSRPCTAVTPLTIHGPANSSANPAAPWTAHAPARLGPPQALDRSSVSGRKG